MGFKWNCSTKFSLYVYGIDSAHSLWLIPLRKSLGRPRTASGQPLSDAATSILASSEAHLHLRTWSHVTVTWSSCLATTFINYKAANGPLRKAEAQVSIGNYGEGEEEGRREEGGDRNGGGERREGGGERKEGGGERREGL